MNILALLNLCGLNVCGLNVCGVILSAAPGVSQPVPLADLLNIPREKRLAYINGLRVKPSANAADAYTRAWQSFSLLYDFQGDLSEEEVFERNEVFEDLNEVLLRLDWNDKETRVLSDWLKRNQQTLEQLKQACATEHAWWEVDLSFGDDADDDEEYDPKNVMYFVQLNRMAKLAATRACAHANQGEWDEAVAWNLRILDMARHVAQQPGAIESLSALSIEILGINQATVFIQEQPDKFPWTLYQKFKHGDDAEGIAAATEAFEHIYTLNELEDHHAWARGQFEGEPTWIENIQLREDWSASVDQIEKEIGEEINLEKAEIEAMGIQDWCGKQQHESVDAIRKALLATSVAKEWRAYEVCVELWRKWARQPFHLAWRQRHDFARSYGKALRDSPTNFGLVCGIFPIEPWRTHALHNGLLLRRNGLATVMLIHEFKSTHGRFPNSLSEIDAKHKSYLEDAFSGRPLIYRLTNGGASFIVYSVGANQVDDGGAYEAYLLRLEGDFRIWPHFGPEQVE